MGVLPTTKPLCRLWEQSPSSEWSLKERGLGVGLKSWPPAPGEARGVNFGRNVRFSNFYTPPSHQVFVLGVVGVFLHSNRLPITLEGTFE